MAAHDTPAEAQPGERYPGETLHLLRSVHADLAYLRGQLDKYLPSIEAITSGGLLGAGRRMRDARNGNRE